MHIGRRIREVRESLGMSAAELARRVGVAPNTVWRYESGEREPSMAMLAKIARELRTEPAELLRDPPHHEDSIIALYAAVEAAAKREVERAKSTPGVLPIGDPYQGPIHVGLLRDLADRLYAQLTQTKPASEELERAKRAAEQADLRLGQILRQIIRPGSMKAHEELEHFRNRRARSADPDVARNQDASRPAE